MRAGRVKLWLVAPAALGVALVYWQRTRLLTAAGEFLDQPTAVERADVVAPLGGSRARLRKAVDLVRSGMAKGLLIAAGDAEERDYACLDLGGGRLWVAGEPAFTTKDEARATRRAAERYGFRKVIVVTSWYHLRRAGKLFRREMEGSGVKVTFLGAGREHIAPDNWWQSYIGLKSVGVEYVGWLVQ